MSPHSPHHLADAFARLVDAPDCADLGPRLRADIRRLSAPVTVAVDGRGGVGVSTVATALASAGLAVVASRAQADIGAHVLAEVVKPEDRAALASADRPTVVVFNKADLSRLGAGGPISAAWRRCAQLQARTGMPTEPMVGLLAVAAFDAEVLDDDLVHSLRLLVNAPADLSSPDAFVDGPHELSQAVRRRLVERLDVFGIAHAVVALRGNPNCDASGLRVLFRQLSCVDAVCATLDGAAAQIRYRRAVQILTELQALAVGDGRVADFLASDEVVEARMVAAMRIVPAPALELQADPLARAVYWRNYGRGPVSELHRACASDIVRGSLRQLAGSAGAR